MSTEKILIVMQFWDGDRNQAMEAARLIADLEPKHCALADFLFVARFDSTICLSTVEHVQRKFNTHTFINRHRRGTGWPFGCNELWFGAMDHIYSMSEAKKFPPYKAILTMEADACPLAPRWIENLGEAWDEQQARSIARVYGAKVDHPLPHVNGNALFGGDLLTLHKISRQIGGCPPDKGWDFILAKKFKEMGWANCPLMRSHWQKKTMEADEIQSLRDAGVFFLHGVKDNSVILDVRKKFLS